MSTLPPLWLRFCNDYTPFVTECQHAVAKSQQWLYGGDMKEGFGARLRVFREQKGLGTKEVGHAVGRSKAWVSRLETGQSKEEPTYTEVVLLAKCLGVSPDELVGLPLDDDTRRMAEIGKEVLGMVERRNLYNVRPVPFVREGRRLPVVNAIAASQLWNEERQVEEMVVVPEMLLQGVADPAAFVVVGDCLRDKGIVTGDYLIVDRANKEPRDGEIVAASVNGEQTAKVFYHVGNTIELRPASAGYETIVVTARDECEIIGVYVARFGKGG